MKKLLVIALAVVLTLSLAVVASAATFSPYVGGEYQITYSAATADKDAPISFNDGSRSMFKAYVTGTAEDADTNTWAKIGVKFTSWNFPNLTTATATDYDYVYEAGIRKIGDVLDIWYTNDENDSTKRGQTALFTSGTYKFGGDPTFNRNSQNTLSIDYKTDAAVVNFGYVLNKANATDQNRMVAAATFKFDGGNVWAGYFSDVDKLNEMGIGAEYKLGFGTIKADYVSKTPNGGTAVSFVQAAVNLEAIKLNATLFYDMKYRFVAADGSLGFGLVYNINDNLYVGATSVSAKDTSVAKDNTDNNIADYFVGVKYGVFDARLGSAKSGTADSYIYATAHVGMW